MTIGGNFEEPKGKTGGVPVQLPSDLIDRMCWSREASKTLNCTESLI